VCPFPKWQLGQWFLATNATSGRFPLPNCLILCRPSVFPSLQACAFLSSFYFPLSLGFFLFPFFLTFMPTGITPHCWCWCCQACSLFPLLPLFVSSHPQALFPLGTPPTSSINLASHHLKHIQIPLMQLLTQLHGGARQHTRLDAHGLNLLLQSRFLLFRCCPPQTIQIRALPPTLTFSLTFILFSVVSCS
jgi:hypothetical protein